MKKNFAAILTAIFSLTAFVSTTQSAAQHAIQRQDGTITASGISMSGADGESVLRMTIDVKENAVSSTQGVAVIPTLSDGTREVSFPYILVNGKERNRLFKRQIRFGNDELLQNPPMQVVVADGRHDGVRIDYTGSVPSEPWMTDATLNLKYVLFSPAGERQVYTMAASGISTSPATTAPPVVTLAPAEPVQRPMVALVPAEPVQRPMVALAPVESPVPAVIALTPDPIFVPDPIPAPPAMVEQPVVALVPARPDMPVTVLLEPVEPRLEPRPQMQGTESFISGTAYLDFEPSSSRLQPYYKRNIEELAVVRKAMEAVAGDPSVEILSLTITGYASPEDRYSTNQSLAWERASAFASLLQREYRLPARITGVRTVGEDWDGLRRMVAGSDISHLNEILFIIDGPDHPDAKESRLRRLAGGQVWRALTDQMFPELRRVEYRIDYRTAK